MVAAHSLIRRATLVALTLSSAVAHSQEEGSGLRTAFGHPDIQGTFTFRTLTPLERPAALEGRGCQPLGLRTRRRLLCRRRGARSC